MQAFNVAAAYSNPPGSSDDLATEYNSLATYLFIWNGIFTCIAIASLRTNVALVMLFWGVVLGVVSLNRVQVVLTSQHPCSPR